MTGARVILADGSMVFCSTYENSELFWALRGAGSSFGIVAEFEFKTFDAPEYVTPFTIELHWNEQAAFDALSALQDFALVAPQTFNMFSFVTATSQVIQGLYFGDKVGLANGLQPLLARVDTTVSDMETVGWLEGHEYFADGEPLDSLAPYNAVCIQYVTIYKPSLMEAHSTGPSIPAVSRHRLLLDNKSSQ
jgi:FAD/FMN-containing dehydrogenase